MTLYDLGWSTSFARSLDLLASDVLRPARVVRQDRNRYLVHDEAGSFPAVLPGVLLRGDGTFPEQPAVGDWVAVEHPAAGDLARLRAVLPRRSAFSRKAAGAVTQMQVVAANLDVVFLVSGLDGDFNLRRIERYVTQAWDSGAVPVVLLNKADLRADVEAVVARVQASAPGVAVHALSALHDAGLDVLQPYLAPGRTVAFVGSSGVGKSTLVNALVGRRHMKTTAVREDDSRGRHTTTHRELIVLPGGAMLIDTPGLRELQVWASAESLDEGFAEVEALAPACRFRDCTHEHEPGCAVRAAVEDGRLDGGRYRNYLKLRRELDYLERRRQESDHEERRRGRKGAILIREALRRKRR